MGGVVQAGAVVIVMMVAGYICPLCNDGRWYCQSWLMIVLIPLANAFHCDHNKKAKNKYEHQCAKDAHQ